LTEESWNRSYALIFELTFQRATCELLSANFEAAEQLIDELLKRATSKAAKADAYRLKVELHVLKSENTQAVDSALECLRVFGIQMSPHPSRAELETAYDEVWRKLGGRPIEALVYLPRLADPDVEAAMSVLSVLFAPAVFTDENLAGLHLCHMVTLTLERGTTDASTHAFGWFGIMLGHFFDRYDEGYRFGLLARALVKRHGFVAFEAKTLFSLELLSLWTRPSQAAIDAIRAAFTAGAESGDITVACYACNHTVSDMLLRGDSLIAVSSEVERGIVFATRANFRDVVDILVAQQRFIQNMRGNTTSFSTFDGDRFDQDSFERQLTSERMSTMVCWYWIIKGQARFISHDFNQAAHAFDRARPLLWSSPGHIQNLDYHFYSALTLAALDDESAGVSARIERIKAHLGQLARWAESCPVTFADKHALVNAELARIEGRSLDAERLYEESARLARENGFVQNEGLANELAAGFYQARGFKMIADACLRNARSCFLRWGADGKVRQLERLHPQLRADPALRPTGTIGTPVEQLDLAIVVKVSEAVSGEIDLKKLIDTLMVMALEHAGAQRGLLILPRGGELRIEAEATTVRDAVEVRLRLAPVTAEELPESILRYVIRTQDSVLLDDALDQNPFSDDAYIRQNHSRSVLCLPLTKQAKLIGVLYLENSQTSGVFTPTRISVLRLLASQAAISLENARLYAELLTENYERRRVEEALRKSEASLAEGQRISHTGNWRWNVRTGVAWGSDETFRIFGIDPSLEQFSYDIYMQVVHPEDRPVVEQALARAVIETSSFQYDYRVLMADGSIKHLQSTGYPEVGESGEPEFVGTVMDITERKQAEEALRRAQAELAQVSRLSTMGELAGSIIHEVNQPLAAIMTNAEACLRWLDRDTPELPEARAAIARVTRDGQRAADVIKGLRALAHRSGLELVQVDINDAVREVLALLRGELERGKVVLHVDLFAENTSILGDRVQLQQVLVNLIRNGIDAMNAVADRPRMLRISSALEADEAVISVEDTGAGLDPAISERMFEPLFTTKPSGMGMGLSICRSIVEAHRGRLWASPSVPYGTIMRFTLPLAGAQQIARSKP